VRYNTSCAKPGRQLRVARPMLALATMVGMAAMVFVTIAACSAGGPVSYPGPPEAPTTSAAVQPTPLETLGFATPILSATKFERVTDTAAVELTAAQIDDLKQMCEQAAAVHGGVNGCRGLNLARFMVEQVLRLPGLYQACGPLSSSCLIVAVGNSVGVIQLQEKGPTTHNCSKVAELCEGVPVPATTLAPVLKTLKLAPNTRAPSSTTTSTMPTTAHSGGSQTTTSATSTTAPTLTTTRTQSSTTVR
jgi:hypothetical protein